MDDPYLDAGMRGWIVNFARSSYWRVQNTMELDDLISEGYLAYYRCRDRYTDLTQRKHPSAAQRRQFMALVKVAFRNRITTLAWEATNRASVMSDEGTPLPVVTYNEGPLAVLLAKAPKEIGDILSVFVKDAMEGGTYLRSYLNRRVRIGDRAIRETTDQKISRLLGRTETNCLARVRDWLSPLEKQYVSIIVEPEEE